MNHASLHSNEVTESLTAEMLNSTARQHGIGGRYNEAVVWAEKALDLARKTHDKRQEATALTTLGNIAGEWDKSSEAEEKFRQAILLFECVGDKNGVALATGSLGGVYWKLSDYPRALKYYGKALDLMEQIGHKSGVAAHTGNIGMVYMELADYPRALEYYHKALELTEHLGNITGVATYTGNIGTVYYELLDNTRALEYFAQALALYEELDNKRGIATQTGNIGTVYAKLSEYSLALEYFVKALAIDEELESRLSVARHVRNIGLIYAVSEFNGCDFAKAEEYFLKALALFDELHNKHLLCLTHQALSDLYEKQERWQEAFRHKSRYHEVKDEIQNEETKKQAEKYDTDRKLAVERERARAMQELLHNTLPPEIADRILRGERMIADHYEAVSILFMDLVDFTTLAQRIRPKHLVRLLNTIFSAADAVMQKYSLEKIKTIGDAYMAVAGAPIPQTDHVQRTAAAALELLETMNQLQIQMPEESEDNVWATSIEDIQVRIGLHCGAAIGGVIGDKKFTFDLWGDAVNTAARMESYSEPGMIQVSEDFAKNLTHRMNNPLQTFPEKGVLYTSFLFPIGEGEKGVLRERGEILIKGKGKMRTYFLEKQ